MAHSHCCLHYHSLPDRGKPRSTASLLFIQRLTSQCFLSFLLTACAGAGAACISLCTRMEALQKEAARASSSREGPQEQSSLQPLHSAVRRTHAPHCVQPQSEGSGAVCLCLWHSQDICSPGLLPACCPIKSAALSSACVQSAAALASACASAALSGLSSWACSVDHSTSQSWAVRCMHPCAS